MRGITAAHVVPVPDVELVLSRRAQVLRPGLALAAVAAPAPWVNGVFLADFNAVFCGFSDSDDLAYDFMANAVREGSCGCEVELVVAAEGEVAVDLMKIGMTKAAEFGFDEDLRAGGSGHRGG